MYGCIGKKLTHSFSKEIHNLLADYEYNLIPLNEDEIAPFFEKREFKAINVTIPYKETVIPYLDEISETAKKIGAVNTIVNKEGRLFGFNTDFYGLKALIEKTGLTLKNKKVLILGTGGTGKAAKVVAESLGAKEILTVSRQENPEFITYKAAETDHNDTEIIINTTPVGMYPNVEETPINLDPFKNLEGVIDAVYNPLCTELLFKAKEKGVKVQTGLYMLVMQALSAVEKFLNKELPIKKAEEVYKKVLASKENIVLSGMPGSGKSTLGNLIKLDGFRLVDTDKEVENLTGCSIKSLILEKGEEHFRNIESKVIADLSLKTGLIIATGGGAMIRPQNVKNLKRNGKIYYLDAPLIRLVATEDRPLSNNKEKLEELYIKRKDIYERTADVIVPNMDILEEVEYILAKRMELLV